ncbi:hypothetical protein STEG23_018767, partial [Scotinomys teguina]
MARKAGQWEEEEVAQSHEEEERRQPAMKRRCRVTDQGLIQSSSERLPQGVNGNKSETHSQTL